MFTNVTLIYNSALAKKSAGWDSYFQKACQGYSKVVDFYCKIMIFSLKKARKWSLRVELSNRETSYMNVNSPIASILNHATPRTVESHGSPSLADQDC